MAFSRPLQIFRREKQKTGWEKTVMTLRRNWQYCTHLMAGTTHAKLDYIARRSEFYPFLLFTIYTPFFNGLATPTPMLSTGSENPEAEHYFEARANSKTLFDAIP